MEDRGTFIIDEACLNNGKARPQNWGLNLQFRALRMIFVMAKRECEMFLLCISTAANITRLF